MDVGLPVLNVSNDDDSVQKYTFADGLQKGLAGLHLTTPVKMVDVKINKEPNYSIVRVTPKDHQRILEYLKGSFFRDEPLNVCVNLLPDEDSTCVELEQFVLDALDHDISFVALDDEGEVIGVCANALIDISKDTSEEDMSVANECPNPKFKKILRLLATVDMNVNYRRRYPHLENMGDVIILSVDDRFRGRGIAKQFLDHTIELLRGMHHRLLVIVCTSAYSAKAATKMGFDVIYRLPFEDYKDGDDEPIFRPAYPHTEVAVGVLEL